MNKKIKIGLFVFIIIGVVILNFMYKNEETKTKKKKQSNLAIMIKGDSGEYVNSDTIPKGNYVLNEEKTVCENGGKVVSYNNSTGQIGFSFLGSDRCSLYFDKIIDTQKPAISNLNVNGKNVTATLTDNEGLKAYGFSTSNTIEPTSWTTISGTSYNLSTTITTEGTYYLWVKDSAGNKAVSNVIDLETKGWQTILANNTVNEATPDFSKVATTNEGLFKADDDYTATTGMKSYYFRGAVDNNWVKFGKDSTGKDIYWRIIRLNGDGSIRMIYTGTSKPESGTATVMTGEGTQISTSAFNSSYNNPAYVGYMYTASAQHGNSTSSPIKTTIDNWYKTTTLETDTTTKSLVADQIFCNDRSATTSSSGTPGEISGSMSTSTDYLYGAYVRLVTNKSPQLKCPTESDKFTSRKSSIGNKALTYPVGLITADEVAMAGGVYGNSNTNRSYYLYTNQNYWSGSPFYFSSGRSLASEFSVTSSGLLYAYSVDYNYGARPVINLSSKAKLTGDGTWNNVYEVIEETPITTLMSTSTPDVYNENGLRYEGAAPNNYICLDNKTSGACSNSSLLFRIIGLFDEEYSLDGTSSSGTKKLLKVIDTNNYGINGKKWNSAETNNWSNASLKTEINGTYLTTLLGTSNVNSKLNTAIVTTKWHLGGASESNFETLTAEGLYEEERNTSAIYSGNPASIYAKVGLMYPSDYGYATIGGSTTNKAGCRAQALYNWRDSSYSDCKNNDWVFKSQNWLAYKAEWLLSPYSSNSLYAANLRQAGFANLNGSSNIVSTFSAVRPTFYLDSSILKIVGTGDGTKDNAYRVG